MSRNQRAGLVASDPEWEKAKAARRSIDHNDAAQESFFLLWSDRMAASPVLRLVEQVKAGRPINLDAFGRFGK